MAVLTRREWLFKAGIGVGAVSLAPSILADEPQVGNVNRNKISDEDEIALGKKFGAQLEKEEPIVSNPILDRYLTSIVEQLAAKSQRPDMPYYVKLVNTMDVNACSIPGGGLYVNRGLLELVASEDQLVATIAHEIGHVVGRHAINQMVLSFQAKAMLKPVLDNLNKENGVVEKIILKLGGAVAMLAMLHFNRQDEAQADLLGFYEMLRAGWNPNGFVKMFAMLDTVEKQNGGAPPVFLSDHPATPERLAAMQRELTVVTIPPDAKTDSFAFHAAKAALHFLPDPPKPRKPEPEANQ
jgi:predicted Zn-dependent protease